MRRWRVGIALSLSVATAVLTFAVASGRDEPRADCPPSTRSDPARTVRIVKELERALERLTEHADAVRVARVTSGPMEFCYAETSELHEPSLVVLDRRLGDPQAAARAAHLLLHAHVAPPWPPAPELACNARVHAALAAEARAAALETAVAAALGSSVAPERSQADLALAYSRRCREESR